MTCQHCGQPIRTRGPRARYCSSTCNQRAFRRRHGSGPQRPPRKTEPQGPFSLSPYEAKVVRELSRTRGCVDVWQLVDAIGGDAGQDLWKFRAQATVSRIRLKFGYNVIVNERGRGYRLAMPL